MAVVLEEEEDLFEQRRKSSSLSSTTGTNSAGPSAKLTARDRIKERLKRSTSKKESARGGEGSSKAKTESRVDDSGLSRQGEVGVGGETVDKTRLATVNEALPPAKKDTPVKEKRESAEDRLERKEKKKKRHAERKAKSSDRETGKETSGEGDSKQNSGRSEEGGKGKSESGNALAGGSKAAEGVATGPGGWLAKPGGKPPQHASRASEGEGRTRHVSDAKERGETTLLSPIPLERETNIVDGKTSAQVQETQSASGEAVNAKNRDQWEDRNPRGKTFGRPGTEGEASDSDGPSSTARQRLLSGATEKRDAHLTRREFHQHGSSSERSESTQGFLDSARTQGSFLGRGSSTDGRGTGRRGDETELGARRKRWPDSEGQDSWRRDSARLSERRTERNARLASDRVAGSFLETAWEADVAASEPHARYGRSEIEEVDDSTGRRRYVNSTDVTNLTDDVPASGNELLASPVCSLMQHSAVPTAISLWGNATDLSTLIYFPPWPTIDATGEPAYLPQDDGLYVNPKPRTKKGNNRRMVNRLVHECQIRGSMQRWFVNGDENQMRCLGDPLEREMNRPARRYDPEAPYLQYIRHIPSQRFFAAGRPALFRLDIELGRLEFLEHPLASREDTLAGQLLDAFREYKKRERAGLAEFYADKVRAIQASLEAAREGMRGAERAGGDSARMPAALDPRGSGFGKADGEKGATGVDGEGRLAHAKSGTQKLKAMLSTVGGDLTSEKGGLTSAMDATSLAEIQGELREARELRDAEERGLRELVGRMRELYRAIEEAGQRQGFRTTVVQLVFKKEEANAEHDRARFEHDLRLLVDEAAAAHAAASVRDQALWVGARAGITEKLAQAEQRAREARGARQQLQEEARERVLDLEEGFTRGRGLDAGIDRGFSDAEETEAEARARAQVEQCQRELEETVTPERKSFDERRARKKAMKELRSSRYRQPGDPVFSPLLVVGLPRDETNIPKPEAARRRVVGRCRVYARLIVNGHLVGQAMDCHLRQDFSLDFRDVFTLQLVRWPENVKVQLWERGLRDALIAEVFLAVPLPDEAPSVVCPQEYQFTGSVPFAPLWPHTETTNNGTGQTATSGAAGYRVLYPRGVLHARVAWVDTRDERDLENSAAVAPPAPPLLRGLEPGRHRSAIGGIGQVTAFQLAAWLRRTGLDPNDPRNARALELLRAQDACARSGRAFRLHSTDEELRLEGARASKRLALLKLRWNKSGAHSGIEVPLLESHVDEKMLDELAQGGALVRSAPSRSGPPETRQAVAALRATEDRQRRIQDFLSRVQTNIEKHKRLRTGRRQFKVDDVIKDTPLPEFKLNLDFFSHLLAPRRKLRPAKRPVKVLAAHPDRCEVAIYVQKAHNVPVRKDSAQRAGVYAQRPAAGGGRMSGGMAAQSRASSWDRRAVPLLVFEPEPEFPERVCPFVEVSFQGATQRTRASEGPNPQWNELVALPFTPAGGDFSPSALKNCSDILRISLFDEVPAPPDDGEPNAELQQGQPAQRRYLGSFSLLAGSVYQAGGVRGAFPVVTPPVNLGFKQLYDGAATLLTLYITLRPQLAVPQNIPEEVPSGEEEDLARYAYTWQRDVLALPACKGRVIKALATDHEGAAIFLSRFVSPLAPPPGLLDDDPGGPGSKDGMMRRLLRFVSMVPFVEDWAAFQSAGADVWMTCRDFLSLCAGDSEEHALTLCNYFLHSGWSAYVVLGVGTQDAEAACVVTIEGDAAAGGAHDITRVWNASTGKVYAAEDASCELREVGVVFNDRNVWANIQPSGAPWEISWRLDDPRCWRPFFADRPFRYRDLGSVQVPIDYVSLPGDFYKELEACLEREVMDAITASRKLVYTHFNRRCSRILKELLRDLEDDAQCAPLPQPPDVLLNPEDARFAAGAAARRPEVAAADSYAALAPVLKNYDIVGFPLNLPFTDGSAVTDAVLSTHIQHKYHKDVEFAVATYVKPFDVSFVCSIWVYVAALTKK